IAVHLQWRLETIMKVLPLAVTAVILTLVCLGAFQSTERVAVEDFENVPPGKTFPDNPRWRVFPGLRGQQRPHAEIVAGKGRNNSRALAIWHGEKFRTDNTGLHYALVEPLKEGVVWIQC